MLLENGSLRWAPKVPKAKIQRLYTIDSQGILDNELIDEVGWALWSRCDSILTVTAAHHGRVLCPACQKVFARQDEGAADEIILCPECGWRMPWAAYHQTYQGKQLFGANAVDVFEAYHQAFPRALDANLKMLLIDQLIHAFHIGLTDIGRPVAANLIEGSLKEVIRFLDTLTNGDASATGLVDSRPAWRRTLASASWAGPFIPPRPNEDPPQDV